MFWVSTSKVVYVFSVREKERLAFARNERKPASHAMTGSKSLVFVGGKVVVSKRSQGAHNLK